MIYIPISVGELYDKITILQIKRDNLTDTAKLEAVEHELLLLTAKTLTLNKKPSDDLIDTLSRVNNKLWEIEDSIREYEAKKDFKKGFVALARSVYIQNDLRSALKARINKDCDSGLIEVKSYSKYD